MPAVNVGWMGPRTRSAACGALVLLAATATAASAEPHVVLVETRGAPTLPTLAAQVEMHAAQGTRVRTVAEPTTDPMTFAQRAPTLATGSDGTTIVVWIAPVENGFLVFAAGRWPGRALIELVRIEAATEPAEIERTIALKIAALLDALLAPRPASVMLNMDVPRQPAPWRVELELAAVREARDRKLDGRVMLSLARAWSLEGWSVAPVVGAYWQPTGTIEGENGHASIHEVGAQLAVEAGHAVGPFDVFARTRFLAGALLVSGTSNDGRHGDTIVIAPFVGAELGMRRMLSRSAGLGISVGYDFGMIRHQLQIDEETVVDLGRGSLHVGLCLTMSL